MYLRKILIFSIITFLPVNVIAKERDEIIKKLKETNSIKFFFIQENKELIEEGVCIINFPQKLKCNYNDAKQKEIIINKDKMLITQKRYNKSYFYPVKEFGFLTILKKDELIQLIKNSNLDILDDDIKLHIINESDQINISFDKKSFDLKGWKIRDKFNKVVKVKIKILEKNILLKDEEFKIELIN